MSTLFKMMIVAATMAALTGTSQAASITDNIAVNASYDQPDAGQVYVTLPAFSPAFGTLTSVGFSIVGPATESFVGSDPLAGPFPVVYSNHLVLGGDGFLQNFNLGQTTGVGTTDQGEDVFTVNASYQTTAYLADYTDPANTILDLYTYSTAAYTNGDLVPYDDSTSTINGDVAVTFNYTPAVTVPEPASMALLAGMMGLVGVVRRRKGRSQARV